MVALAACGGGGDSLSDYTLTLTPRVIDGQDPFAGSATVKLWVQAPGEEPVVTFVGGADGSTEMTEQPPIATGSRVGLVVEANGADDGSWSPAALQAWGATEVDEELGKGTGEVTLTVLVPAAYQVGAMDRLTDARSSFHTAAAMLPSGDVLLFGGARYHDLSGEESDRILRLTDVNNGDWSFTPVGTKLPDALAGRSATMVEVEGRPMVFVAGGGVRLGDTYSNTELSQWAGLYDPENDAWYWDKAKALPDGFAEHRAVAMANGNVLIVGRHPVLVMEAALFAVFDPDTQKIVADGTLDGLGSLGIMAAPLGLDGALVCGGALIQDRDFTQPVAPVDACVRVDLQGSVRSADSLPQPTAWGSMVGLADGSVLLTGGLHQPAMQFESAAASGQALRYANGKWKDTAQSLKLPRTHHVSVPMFDGGAMVIGGTGRGGVFRGDAFDRVQCAERFDPASESFKQVGCDGAGANAQPAVAWAAGRGAFVLEGWHNDEGSAEGGKLYGWIGGGPE